MKKAKGIVVLLMLIAIINIGCIIKLFLNVDSVLIEINTVTSVIILAMQIISFIISIIILKKGVKVNLKIILIVIAILIATFFIPVQTVYDYLHGSITSFKPVEKQKNLYNITI